MTHCPHQSFVAAQSVHLFIFIFFWSVVAQQKLHISDLDYELRAYWKTRFFCLEWAALAALFRRVNEQVVETIPIESNAIYHLCQSYTHTRQIQFNFNWSKDYCSTYLAREIQFHAISLNYYSLLNACLMELQRKHNKSQ